MLEGRAFRLEAEAWRRKGIENDIMPLASLCAQENRL